MSIQGQILSGSDRGTLLMETIKKENPKFVVEIGTWKGLGSTKLILDSIGDETKFITIESNLEFYNIAKNNLKEYGNKLNILYGTIVSENEIQEYVSDKSLTPQQKGWLHDDLKNINSCQNVLDKIPNQIDFLFLDGGEFSTYNEWLKLKSRTKIVALDDITEMKTKQIYDELVSDPNYELLSKTNDGNGFCIFLKK